MDEIKYHLDQVEVDDQIKIRGWAFSTNKEEVIFNVNGMNIEPVKFEREDVKTAFPNEEITLYSGFEICLPYDKKLLLKFCSKNQEVNEIIDAGAIKKAAKRVKRQKMLKKLTFANFLKVLKYLFKHGVSKTLSHMKHKVTETEVQPISLYEKTLYSEEELEIEKHTEFKIHPKVSVIVPLYNTPIDFLTEMIESVQNQTYSNWELCLADGSDEHNDKVGETCQSFKDDRIVYKKLVKNYGISENTNEALAISTGEYIALFDHDDLLHPAALFEVVKAINDKDADFVYTDEVTFMGELKNMFNPHFKPDFAIDNLRANNYICHFTVFSRILYNEVGGFRSEYDGSQDFDMVLRLTEKARHIYHIPKILYYWRAHKNSVAAGVGAKPYVIEAAHKAIQSHLDRCNIKGNVLDTVVPSMYKINYEIVKESLVSIIIPNKDHIDDLEKCLKSIKSKTTYSNYEIIIVENNSEDECTFEYYNKINDENINVIKYEGIFNYSAINNLGFENAKGEYIILLNNDVEIISESWIEEMLMYCQREDVGVVGAKLYYPDDTIQHAGLGLGLLTLAGHYHRHFPREHPGYMGRLIYAHDVTAVTAACLMVKREVYEEVGGLDETFEVAFNDVDFCMKVRKKGYLIVFTPFAELYHYESKSRGLDSEPQKRERFLGEVSRFQTKWKKELANGDPYYNYNLSLDKEDFSVNTQVKK